MRVTQQELLYESNYTTDLLACRFVPVEEDMTSFLCILENLFSEAVSGFPRLIGNNTDSRP